MNTFKIIVLVLFVAIAASPVQAQGRKDFRDAAVKKEVEYKYTYKTGREVKTINAIVFYDVNGNEIEVREYDDFGKITKHESYTFNSDNDKTSVTKYEPTGKVKKVTKYTLDSDGKKIGEMVYNAAGKLVETSKYTYMGKFKTEKRTYDPANKLIEMKTWTYSK